MCSAVQAHVFVVLLPLCAEDASQASAARSGVHDNYFGISDRLPDR